MSKLNKFYRYFDRVFLGDQTLCLGASIPGYHLENQTARVAWTQKDCISQRYYCLYLVLCAFVGKTYILSIASIYDSIAELQVTLATFTTYSLANLNNPDERLTADKAFVALSLFNILRFPLAMLPMLISNIIQASVSVKRLGNFLKNEELDPNIVDWNLEPAGGIGIITTANNNF